MNITNQIEELVNKMNLAFEIHARNNKMTLRDTVKIDKGGRKYIRIIHSGAYGFVNIENGDFYRPNSWSSPNLKNVRGNVSDIDGLLGNIGVYGAGYVSGVGGETLLDILKNN
jgi:hypothetical protein